MKTLRNGRITFIAIMAALSLVCLLVTILPVSTVALAALAALWGIPVVVELGRPAGLVQYALVTVVAMLLFPPLGGKLMYPLFFGHYTVFKAWLEHFSLPRLVEYLLKSAVFLISLVGYIVLWYLLLTPSLPEWFSLWMAAPLAAVLWGVFMVYDRCLTGMAVLYLRRLHPLVSRLFRFS